MPRLKAGKVALFAIMHRDLFSDDKYERVSHALGKAYRDVVRGFRGEFENPPDLVAFPRQVRSPIRQKYRSRTRATWSRARFSDRQTAMISRILRGL